MKQKNTFTAKRFTPLPSTLRTTVGMFLILLLLCGCDPLNAGDHPSARPTSGSSNELLRVTTSHGLTCSPQEWDILPNALTFATERLSYTSEEIQQMTDYIDKAYVGLFDKSDPEEVKSIPPPTTLQLLPANVTNSIASWNISPENRLPGCLGKMTITNISLLPLLFQGIHVRLAETPQSNTDHYRFLNICSLPLTNPSGPSSNFSFCPSYPQGTSDDPQYTFSLQKAQAGSVFQGVLHTADETSTSNTQQNIRLLPGRSLVLHLNFRTAEQAGNLKYTVIPEIIVTASGKEQIIQAKPVATLVYATADQISCYALQGNHFFPLKQDGVGLPFEQFGPDIIHNHTWCI